MAKDSKRFWVTKSFSPSSIDQVSIPTDATLKRIMLHLKINLSTGSGSAASAPLQEGPFSVIKNLKLILDGKSRHESSGAIRAFLEKHYFYENALSFDPVVAPATSNTSTINAFLPISFGLEHSREPSLGFLDSTNFDNLFLNLSMGDISNLFGTPADTTITSIDVDVYVHEILGLSIAPADTVYIEPVVQTVAVPSSNATLQENMPKGDRDYLAIFLRGESAPDVPSNAVITGAVKVEGSGKQFGAFTPRHFLTNSVIQADNKVDFNGIASEVGYSIIDFVGDGNVKNNAVGTNNLSTWRVVLGVTGGTTNSINIIGLVATK